MRFTILTGRIVKLKMIEKLQSCQKPSENRKLGTQQSRKLGFARQISSSRLHPKYVEKVQNQISVETSVIIVYTVNSNLAFSKRSIST